MALSPPPITPPSSRIFSDEEWRVICQYLRFSRRETQVAQLLFDDKTEYAMAVELEISPHTVHTHLERLHRKLNVNSRTGILLRCFSAFLQLFPRAEQPADMSAAEQPA